MLSVFNHSMGLALIWGCMGLALYGVGAWKCLSVFNHSMGLALPFNDLCGADQTDWFLYDGNNGR